MGSVPLVGHDDTAAKTFDHSDVIAVVPAAGFGAPHPPFASWPHSAASSAASWQLSRLDRSVADLRRDLVDLTSRQETHN